MASLKIILLFVAAIVAVVSAASTPLASRAIPQNQAEVLQQSGAEPQGDLKGSASYGYGFYGGYPGGLGGYGLGYGYPGYGGLGGYGGGYGGYGSYGGWGGYYGYPYYRNWGGLYGGYWY